MDILAGFHLSYLQTSRVLLLTIVYSDIWCLKLGSSTVVLISIKEVFGIGYVLRFIMGIVHKFSLRAPFKDSFHFKHIYPGLKFS